MSNPKRARLFGLVSYIKDTGELISLLHKKTQQIRAYALICHDADKTDVHHHVVVRTHNQFTCEQIRKWFYPNREEQNTLAQFVHDPQGIIDYLTHENEPAEKHRYSVDNIIDGGLSDLIPKDNARDDSFEIIEDVLCGLSTRALVKRYGREYIFHYAQYQAVCEAIKQEDHEEKLRTEQNSAASENYTK